MNNEHTNTWPDLAMGLYDRLTGSNAEIKYDFDQLKVAVPSGTGEKAEHAQWVLNGSVKISTNDRNSSPN